MPQSELKNIAREICSEHGYTFVARVGAGNFKETFHVRLANGTSEALKVFRQANRPDRTDREIDAMTRCDHPNIAKLSSVSTFQAGGHEYLFSLEEYLPGGTLTQRADNRLLSADETQALGNALIQAVAHIASHGFVHRDLKPDNIMFREDGVTPVIVDFGLVRDLDASSITRTWIMRGPGTPNFAAPEQLTNDKDLIDWRTDQFTLGTLLGKVTLGYHPFSEEQDSPAEVIDRVAQRDGPSDRFKQDVKEIDLPALVRMVAPWPVGRFRTPEGLLGSWRAQQGVP